MNQIISLRLGEQEQINIISSVSTLATIVCCDKVSLVFQVQDQTIVMKDCVAVCEIDNFTKGLEFIVNKQQEHISFLDVIMVYGDLFW